jgi:hypothetical protein
MKCKKVHLDIYHYNKLINHFQMYSKHVRIILGDENIGYIDHVFGILYFSCHNFLAWMGMQAKMDPK